MAQFKEKNNSLNENISAVLVIVFVLIFILTNLTFGFILPLYLLAMTFSFFVALIYPRSGLFSLVFLTMLYERFFTLQSFFLGKLEYKIYPLDIVMLGIIFGIVIKIFSNREFKFVRNDLWLIGFIFLNSIYFIASLFATEINFAVSFSVFKNYAFYSLLYFISAYLMRTEQDLKNFFKFIFAGAIGIIVFIIIGILRGEGLWSEFTPLSTEGVRILAFPHGLYLALIVFPVLSLLIKKDNEHKKILYALSIFWVVGIIGTLMRHLWISIFITFMAFVLFFSEPVKKALGKIVINFSLPFVIVLFIAFQVTLISPQSDMTNNLKKVGIALNERVFSLAKVKSDESFSWRGLVWDSAYTEFKQRPFFGLGTGNMIYVEKENYRDFIEIRNIHNSYLAILFQFGIFGFLLMAIFIFNVFKKLLLSFRNEKLFAYKFSVLGMLLIFLLSFPFQPYLETNLLAVFFWLMLGIARNLGENKA